MALDWVTDEELREAMEYRYNTPEEALGMCYAATEELIEQYLTFDMVLADHSNDPVGRWNNFRQHSNHFAAYDEESNTVVDFTMRQFIPDTPYPYRGTLREWLTILADTWDTKVLRFAVNCDDLDMDEDDFTSDEEYEDYVNGIGFWNRDTGVIETEAGVLTQTV